MPSTLKNVTEAQRLRDLTDKELNEIMKAVGDRARAQTIEQKKKMKTSLRKELVSARSAYLSYAKKNL